MAPDASILLEATIRQKQSKTESLPELGTCLETRSSTPKVP